MVLELLSLLPAWILEVAREAALMEYTYKKIWSGMAPTKTP